jgi:hypothetical protein
MDRAVMNEANLKDAILERAVFTRSDLTGAIVDGADFTNALVDKTQQMVRSGQGGGGAGREGAGRGRAGRWSRWRDFAGSGGREVQLMVQVKGEQGQGDASSGGVLVGVLEKQHIGPWV